MDIVIKEVENLCLSMHTFKEHLEDNPQLPILGEKLRYFASEIERIVAIKPVCLSRDEKELSPVLVMRLEQAKDKLESLSECNTVYEIITELSDISSRIQEAIETAQSSFYEIDDIYDIDD